MQSKKSNLKNSAFLIKTYQILQNHTFQNIVSWHIDGIGFVIHNIDKFTDQVLPMYFKHSNFASFIRQLNMYGFSKKRSLKSQNYYHHIKFQRNSKELIKQIQRKIQKKTQKLPKQSSNPNDPQSQQKIHSQFSIQLQSKTTPKKQYPKSSAISQQKLLNCKLNTILTSNESLLNIQLKSCLQVISDLSKLKFRSINQLQKQQLQNILIQNMQYECTWLNKIKQKIRLVNNNNINRQDKNQQIVGTKQSLKIKNNHDNNKIDINMNIDIYMNSQLNKNLQNTYKTIQK